MTSDEIRAEFPGTRSVAYFNAASASLLPSCVAAAMDAVSRGQVQRGILGWAADMRAVEAARAAIARRIGASPADVAFVGNTAEAIGRIAAGFDWREGDEVVLGDLEYPANVYPWAAQRDRGVRLRIVRSEAGRLPAERLIAAIGPRTRVLAVSHVQFGNGYRVDLAALGEACRGRGVLLCVDAIQGLGVFPVDVGALGIGALSSDGRKWLMGPAGTGILYVAPEWQERIRPRIAGALSVKRSSDMRQYLANLDASGQLDLAPLLRDGAGRYEAGYPNAAPLAGLGAALDLAERIGATAIREAVEARVARLLDGLAAGGFEVAGPRSSEERSGIVAFDVPGDPDAWFHALSDRGISLAVREGRLRVAPHVYNDDGEIDRLVAALGDLRRSPGRA